MIKTFRHALALDERRVKFEPTYWQLSTPQPPTPKPGQGTTPAALALSSKKSVDGHTDAATSEGMPHPEERGEGQKVQLLSTKEEEASRPTKKAKKLWKQFQSNILKHRKHGIVGQDIDLETTDVKQVWFSGCHSGEHTRSAKSVYFVFMWYRCGWRRHEELGTRRAFGYLAPLDGSRSRRLEMWNPV